MLHSRSARGLQTWDSGTGRGTLAALGAGCGVARLCSKPVPGTIVAESKSMSCDPRRRNDRGVRIVTNSYGCSTKDVNFCYSVQVNAAFSCFCYPCISSCQCRARIIAPRCWDQDVGICVARSCAEGTPPSSCSPC